MSDMVGKIFTYGVKFIIAYNELANVDNLEKLLFFQRVQKKISIFLKQR